MQSPQERSNKMKTKKQNKNQYDKNRKAIDPWYHASKNARSLLSGNIRKYLNTGIVPSSPTLERLIGCPLHLFLPRLVIKADLMGYDLFTQYGSEVEIDHAINPVAVYAAAAKWNLRDALQDCFYFNNLTIVPIKENRNHNLKPSVKRFMGKKAV